MKTAVIVQTVTIKSSLLGKIQRGELNAFPIKDGAFLRPNDHITVNEVNSKGNPIESHLMIVESVHGLEIEGLVHHYCLVAVSYEGTLVVIPRREEYAKRKAV